MNQKVLLLFLAAFAPFSLKAQNSELDQSDPSLRQLQNCQPGCLTCSSSEVCLNCDSHRVLEDGKCRCESPRILVSTHCKCPWYMSENPTTQNCEYIDLLDVAYHPETSPLFEAIFQVKINQILKYTLPPTFTWTINCNHKSTEKQSQLQTYLSSQKSDFLSIPSSLLEHNLECDGKVIYINQNSLEVSKNFAFTTASYFQPQVRIVGGAFQMFTHSQVNLIVAEVVSLTGSPIFPSDLKITWTQVNGRNKIDVTEFSSSSKPLKLTIPKCKLSQGEFYTFRIDVQIGLNPVISSQEVTIGVYAPKINLKPINAETYHIYTKDLKLTASEFSVEDECQQGLLPMDFLDLSTVKYTWECKIVDLYSPNRRLLYPSTESTDINNDLNVITHPDPQHLFYRSTTSKTITIPKTYFTHYKDYQFIFYLTVTVQSIISTPSLTNFNLLRPKLHILQSKAYVQILASKPFTAVSFSCQNENDCEALSDDTTQLIGLNYNPQYTYTWIVNAFSASESHESYKKWMTFFVLNTGSSQKIVPQIILQVTDGTDTASSFFTLPLQTPVKKGSLYINPTSGEAYKTNFFVSTYLNKDDDLPLTFQFFSNCKNRNNYMLQKYEPFDSTLAILPPGYNGCQLGVLVTDNLGNSQQITDSVSLTGRCTSLLDNLNKNYLALDASRSSSNLYQRFRLLSIVMESLRDWEDYDTNETLNVTSSQFKYSAISEMKDIFVTINPRKDTREIMLNNIKYATQQLFNEDQNWNLYMSIMDDYYQANSINSILNSGEFRTFAGILDNLIWYMKKPGNSIEDPEKVWTYSNTLIRSSLASRAPTDGRGVFNYDGIFYSIITLKTTYCKILENVIEVTYYYGLQANFTIKPDKTISPEKCSKEADFVFMSFRPNYTVEGWGEFRTLISLDLRDSITGKSILDLYNFFLFSPIEFCPVGALVCVNDPNGGTTIYGAFDLKNQIYKIFGKSKIDQIVNISALKDFKFWQSVAFWTIIGFSLWFLVSFYWLYIKHPTYCALLANKTISQKPLYQKTNFFFWLVHPLIGIYMYHDIKNSKATRLALYYQRLVVVMLFSTLFSSISKGEGAVFRAYIILFNACTVTPINLLLSRTFGWAFKLKITKKKLISYIKQSLVIFLYISFLIGCFIAIFIIEAQQDESQNKSWAINFAISFIQDLTLAPFLSITIKVLIIKFSQSKKTAKLKKTQKLISLLLENFKTIYNPIFEKKMPPTLKEIQSPTPTEIASPMSTSRKLLKLATLDSSPTLPTSPGKRVFRTRRVSDTEMGNIDSVAAETLVTDRFQTLFSEGKTSRIKELNPVKENYERMQSANLPSPGRPRNLIDPHISDKRNFVNLASIMLTPKDSHDEIAPEDDLFSPDVSLQDTPIKSLKAIKPFGTSVFSTEEKMKDKKALGTSFFSTQEKIKKPQPERCQTTI